MVEAVATSETDIEDLATAMENLARFMRFQNFAAPFETAPVPDLKRLVESLSEDERDALVDACDWLTDDATAHRDVRGWLRALWLYCSKGARASPTRRPSETYASPRWITRMLNERGDRRGNQRSQKG